MKISNLFDIFRTPKRPKYVSLINCKEAYACNQCRVTFICAMMTRRYHCRACGHVFCSKCSSKSCHLPKLDIEHKVIVCDPCFNLYGPKEEVGARPAAQQQKKS